MKRLPKYTPAEVRNDPYGFTYKEKSDNKRKCTKYK